MGKFNSIGRKLARDWFSARGNHSEMHIEEVELAAMLSVAAEVAVKSSETTDLLEAAKYAAEAYDHDESCSGSDALCVVCVLSAAIAKAEGGESD